MKRLTLLIPFLLTLASLLQLSVIASVWISPEQLLRPLVVLWLILAVLIWPAYWITRDWTWTALLLSVFVVGFYFSPEFFTIVFLLTLLGSIFWLAYIRLRRKKIQPSPFLNILAGVALLFIVYALALMGSQLKLIDWQGYRQAVSAAKNYSLPSLVAPTNPPDIYYIVLDGYIRSDILKEMYHFDNSDFLTNLKGKGFIVPPSNHSNYPATPLSISSTLNMDYIQSLVPVLKNTPQRWLLKPFIDQGRVRALLESQGYQTISLSTDWSITENDTTDLYLHAYPVMLTEFERFVLGKTPLRMVEPLLKGFASIPNANTHRKIIQYSFDATADLPNIPGPKFVFVHIISPHPPFLFDKDGNPVFEEDNYPFSFKDANEYELDSRGVYAPRYVEQVQFVNHEVEKMVDRILAQSKTPPIILIQSDHGSGMLTDLGSPDKSCIRERFSPFAAYYLPGVKPKSIPEDISNVNIFRIVLNEYFKAGLPLLESRQYFNKDMQQYFEFVDVSGRLDDSCSVPKE
jgi:hypothetical protein